MQFKACLITLIATCITSTSAIDFSGSNYIWTNEAKPGPGGDQPIGSRPFRRAAYSPRGKRTFSADILISADNGYDLFVNEVKIGSGSSFQAAQLFHVPLTRSGCNIFAVNATNLNNGLNTANPAGLVAKIKIHYTDGSSETIVTDQSWRTFGSVPVGFQREDFFDGNWAPATVENTFEARPAYWQQIAYPADVSQF